jgi:hypothetical protein
MSGLGIPNGYPSDSSARAIGNDRSSQTQGRAPGNEGRNPQAASGAGSGSIHEPVRMLTPVELKNERAELEAKLAAYERAQSENSGEASRLQPELLGLAKTYLGDEARAYANLVGTGGPSEEVDRARFLVHDARVMFEAAQGSPLAQAAHEYGKEVEDARTKLRNGAIPLRKISEAYRDAVHAAEISRTLNSRLLYLRRRLTEVADSMKKNANEALFSASKLLGYAVARRDTAEINSATLLLHRAKKVTEAVGEQQIISAVEDDD